MSHTPNGIKNGGDARPTAPKPVTTPANRGMRESHVSFQTAVGLKLHGTITHFNRQVAVCEIYGGSVGLRMSEALKDFQINVRGEIIYSGRAVVSSLMEGGGNTICEVMLDESHWTGINLLPALKSSETNQLALEFKSFLNDRQSLYKINPEYKLAVMDMQAFFGDLRLWMNQLELGLDAIQEEDRSALERKLIAEMGPLVFPIFAALFERFEIAARAVEKSQLATHQALVKRLLHPLILCSPFMHRIYFKPLGYAGDYEMVNMILRDPHEGGTLFAKLLNVFILGQVPGEAHRNRVTYLVNRLVEETRRMSSAGGICRIYNLGCGPAGEIQQFLKNHTLSQHAQFTLLDADEETLRNTGKLLENLKSVHHRRTPIKMVKKSVHQMLKPSDKNKSGGEQYDFIYSAGLFDYLTDQVGRIIIELTYSLLAPGGLLLITNVDPVNPIKNIMDHIYDWHLIYRNGQELAALADGLPADATIAIRAEYTSANVILEVRKSPLPS